jgi:Aldehyde dehydrogenase family
LIYFYLFILFWYIFSLVQRVMGYINSGKRCGATLHCGGVQHGKEGYFIRPTIFTNVDPSMQIAREEIFGPVVVLIKFKTEEGKKNWCFLGYDPFFDRSFEKPFVFFDRGDTDGK